MGKAVRFVKCKQEDIEKMNLENQQVDIYLNDNTLYFVQKNESKKVEVEEKQEEENDNPFLNGIEISFENLI